MCGVLPTCKAISSRELQALHLGQRLAPLVVTNQGMLFPGGEFQCGVIQALHEVPEAGDVNFILDSLQQRRV